LREGILTRSDSPLPEATPSDSRPSWYNGFPQEFDELISRGATPAFCEIWRARFNEDSGIVVQPSDDFKGAYGALIEDLDFPWSIWIGRHIKLDDDDLDGSLFMESLLDIIFYEDDDGLWITYKDHKDSWVTRPSEGPEIEGTVEVLEVADEYEVWSEEEEEEEEEDDHEPSHPTFSDNESPEAESTSSGCESTWWSDDSENEMEVEDGESVEGIEANILWAGAFDSTTSESS